MKKTIAIFLCSLMLVSVLSASISNHYCGGMLTNVNSFSKSCCCEQTQDLSLSNEKSIKKSCCSNHSFHLLLNQKEQSFELTSKVDFNLIAIFIPLFSINFERIRFSPKYLNYKPPIPEKDIPVLFQSFLI